METEGRVLRPLLQFSAGKTAGTTTGTGEEGLAVRGRVGAQDGDIDGLMCVRQVEVDGVVTSTTERLFLGDAFVKLPVANVEELIAKAVMAASRAVTMIADMCVETEGVSVGVVLVPGHTRLTIQAK